MALHVFWAWSLVVVFMGQSICYPAKKTTPARSVTLVVKNSTSQATKIETAGQLSDYLHAHHQLTFRDLFNAVRTELTTRKHKLLRRIQLVTDLEIMIEKLVDKKRVKNNLKPDTSVNGQNKNITKLTKRNTNDAQSGKDSDNNHAEVEHETETVKSTVKPIQNQNLHNNNMSTAAVRVSKTLLSVTKTLRELAVLRDRKCNKTH